MTASRDSGLQKPPPPTPMEGGSSNGLAYRAAPAGTGEPKGSPSEPPKTGGTDNEAADSAEETTAFVVEQQRDANPGHAFFAQRAQ